ncbi:MAG: glycosyltransferase family 4 protein [Rhodothermales bacterium]
MEKTRNQGLLAGYYAYSTKASDTDKGVAISNRPFRLLARYSPLRYSPGMTNYIIGELFDRRVATLLKSGPDAHIGFGGKTLHTFRRARKLGTQRLELVAANSHVNNVRRKHALGIHRYPLEESWLNEAQHRKTLREYALADLIYVASEYTRRSFLNEGIPESKLQRVYYETNPRFHPPTTRPDDGIFRVVYVGSVTVMKGIPVLLEAFARLPFRQAELTLVGSPRSRDMRRYLQHEMATDPRIRLRPGDPLPHLHRADVCVHPTFEDGFAYAPMEALACGVPVIVTEDTGMKEYVEEGSNGFIIPTGDVEALVEHLVYLREHMLDVPSTT